LMAEVHQPVKRVVPKTFLYHLTCCYHITIFFLLSKMSEAILAAHPKLNLRRVRRWVREFASALSMPEILNDLEALLSQRQKLKR